MPDQNHTEILVRIAELATTMEHSHEKTSEILDRVTETNGKVAKCVTDIAVHQEMIETSEEKIVAQGDKIESLFKSIGKLSVRVALIAGGIVGIEKLGSWLVG